MTPKMDDAYAKRLGSAYLQVLDADQVVETSALSSREHIRNAARYRKYARLLLDTTLVQGGFPPIHRGFFWRYCALLLFQGVWLMRFPIGVALLSFGYLLLGVGWTAWIGLALAVCLAWVVLQDLRAKRSMT